MYLQNQYWMIYEMKFDFWNGILLGIEGIRQNYQQLPLLMKQVIFTGIDNIIQILLRYANSYWCRIWWRRLEYFEGNLCKIIFIPHVLDLVGYLELWKFQYRKTENFVHSFVLTPPPVWDCSPFCVWLSPLWNSEIKKTRHE